MGLFDNLGGFDFEPNLDYTRKPDIYDVSHPGLLYLKDSLANSAKKSQTLQDMFSPQNLSLTTDEYVSKQNHESVAPTVAKGLENTAHLSDDEFYQRLNHIRQLTGQMPLKPEQAPLNQPNTNQAVLAAVASLLFPGHAMDSAAVPFQHQLAEQQKQQNLNNQEFASKQAQWQTQLQLEEQANQQLNQRDVLRYQSDTNRQESDIDRKFREGLQAKGFNQQLTMFGMETKRMFDLADVDQKNRIALSLLNEVSSGDPSRSPWARQMLAGMGYDVPQLEGKPLAVQMQELQIQTSKNQEEFNQKMRPLELQKAGLQNKILGKEYQWYDKEHELNYLRGQWDIKNTQSIIGDRSWQQNFATSEQQRQYLNELNSSVSGGMKALGSQLDSLEEEIRRTFDQESKSVSPDEKKSIQDRRKTLEGQRDDTRKALEGMQSSWDSLNTQIKEKAGVAPGATDLGAVYIGVPYSWGGGTLTAPSKGIGKGAGTVGFDCSGLTRAVAYNDFGVTIPRTAKEQYAKLSPVKPGEGQTGDFLYWSSGSEWHTGILIFKDGVPFVRQAPNTGSKVQDTPLESFKTSKKFMGVRRAWKEQSLDMGKLLGMPWLNGGN